MSYTEISNLLFLNKNMETEKNALKNFFLQHQGSDIHKKAKRIIHLVRSQNFPKN